jgi:hypothetical protein
MCGSVSCAHSREHDVPHFPGAMIAVRIFRVQLRVLLDVADVWEKCTQVLSGFVGGGAEMRGRNC